MAIDSGTKTVTKPSKIYIQVEKSDLFYTVGNIQIGVSRSGGTVTVTLKTSSALPQLANRYSWSGSMSFTYNGSTVHTISIKNGTSIDTSFTFAYVGSSDTYDTVLGITTSSSNIGFYTTSSGTFYKTLNCQYTLNTKPSVTLDAVPESVKVGDAVTLSWTITEPDNDVISSTKISRQSSLGTTDIFTSTSNSYSGTFVDTIPEDLAGLSFYYMVRVYDRYSKYGTAYTSNIPVSASGGITGSVNIDGTYKELTDEGYVNIGGVWKELVDSYANVNGVWHSLKG